MKVKILASGSKGNCIYIHSGDVSILVDVGLPKTKIEKRLNEADIYAPHLDAVLITHAHGDHVAGLPLADKYRIPVYASDGEWKQIQNSIENYLQYVAKPGLHFAIQNNSDWLDVTPFSTHHDAYWPLGYAIMDRDQKVSVCLDTGHVDREMLAAMADSDIYIIESNHEPALVEISSRPDSVKARILSDLGHLSNEQTADALYKLVRGKGERIYLTHLSSENNTPQLAENTVKLKLLEKGLQAGKHYFLEVC